MSRHIVPLFDQNRQLFIKIEVLQSADTFWLRGQEYRWKDLEIPVEKVKQLYDVGYIYHNEELEDKSEKRVIVGDGLEDLTIEQLTILVENINAKIKDGTPKCQFSKIKYKQVGHIRSWRTNYGHLE